MQILKNRAVAVVIAVAVIAFSSFFGIFRSLSSIVNDIGKSFYDGECVAELSERFNVEIREIDMKKSVQNDLDTVISSSENIVKITTDYYGSQDTDVIELKNITAKLKNSEKIKDKYLNYTQLVEKLFEIDEKIKKTGIDKVNDKYIGQYENIQSAKKKMSRNGYNAIAREFNENIADKFPASIIAELFAIEAYLFE